MKTFSVITFQKITRSFWLIIEYVSSYMANKGEFWWLLGIYYDIVHCVTFPECTMLHIGKICIKHFKLE